jgi:hypothetical protein
LGLFASSEERPQKHQTCSKRSNLTHARHLHLILIGAWATRCVENNCVQLPNPWISTYAAQQFSHANNTVHYPWCCSNLHLVAMHDTHVLATSMSQHGWQAR